MQPPPLRIKTLSLVIIAAALVPAPAVAQAQPVAKNNTYATKGCAQIGDTLVCGAAEILAAVAAALAAERIVAAAAKAKSKNCFCVCGSSSNTKPLRHMPEFECRATCVIDHNFSYGDYSCK